MTEQPSDFFWEASAAELIDEARAFAGGKP